MNRTQAWGAWLHPWPVGILLLSLSACSPSELNTQRSTTVATTTPSPITAMPAPAASPSPAPPAPNPYDIALDKAVSARSISSSAQSQDDWALVAAQWQDAIALLKTIPPQSPQAKQARTKLKEYQNQLAIANRKAQGSFKTAQAPGSSSPAPTNPVYTANQPKSLRVPILYRLSNTPVIQVTFNGSQTFAMILDTGASGTVVTPDMARSLGLKPTRQAIVNTASEKGLVVPVAITNSVAVGDLVVPDLPVAIAGPELEIGLLGQNFFEGYDLIIRRNYVEFQAH